MIRTQYPYTLAANGRATIQAHGSRVKVESATGAFKLWVDNEQPLPLEAGMGVALPEGRTFNQVQIQDTSGASNTIILTVSDHEILDYRSTITGSITSKSGDTLESPAAVSVDDTATALVAADANRSEVIVQNHGATPVWIGDANVDADNNRGIQLPEKDGNYAPSIVLSTGAAVYGMRATGAAAEDVSIIEVSV